MKFLKHGLPVLLLAAGAGFTSTASAALFVRPGGMVYDSDRNITWLQDANYAQTSGYDADGLMSWTAANTWASNLVYDGYSDWRLPTLTDIGNDGCNFNFAGTDCGYNVDTASSEIAHVWTDELGNLAIYNPDTTVRAGGGLQNISPFTNLGGPYWFGTPYVTNSFLGWAFDTNIGYQATAPKTDSYFGWAVRNGDVTPPLPLPEPGGMTLLGAGLMGWLGARVRRRA